MSPQRARLPDVVQPVINVLPLTVLNTALRAIANDDACVVTRGFPVIVLAVWGIATSVTALRWFRWT